MRIIFNILIVSLLIISCDGKDKMLIAKNQLGEITNKTTFDELDKMFAEDSVVKTPTNSERFNKYKVYKNGNLIMTIRPKYKNDSILGVENIKIFSNLYKTKNGVSTSSTFKDVLNNYSVKKIQPTFNSAVVFIDELNATFALDKKDLKLNEFDMNKIEKGQIPDMAKILYITIWFD